MIILRTIGPALVAAGAVITITMLAACGDRGEVNDAEAANLAAEFEAGADNATDATQADILRDRANSIREQSGEQNAVQLEGSVPESE